MVRRQPCPRGVQGCHYPPHQSGIPISSYIDISGAEHGIRLKELCPNATEVVRDLQKAGYEAFIVGGGVRDLLLGKAPKDFDVATDATPEQVHAIFPRCRLIGRRFRLAHVRQRGALIEVATFRGPHATEEDSGNVNGRILADNVFGTVEEDAIRRDFTINAMFLDPVSGTIRDFVGGYRDLKERRLRLIGDAEKRYREDPVRLLRAARFVAKLGVEPDAATEEPIHRLAVLLEDVPPARLFEELSKLFLTGHALRSMEALQRFGLSAALFPVMPRSAERGRVVLGPLLRAALENTDQRVHEGKPVTPSFLLAALFWQPVRQSAEARIAAGEAEYEALMNAADEVFHRQSRRTAIPRRFSAVTKQIWTMQTRLNKTKGRRWARMLQEPRFRAAYDFLLLRAIEDPQLEPLSRFWTEAQQDQPAVAPEPVTEQPRRRRRPRTRRRRQRA